MGDGFFSWGLSFHGIRPKFRRMVVHLSDKGHGVCVTVLSSRSCNYILKGATRTLLGEEFLLLSWSGVRREGATSTGVYPWALVNVRWHLTLLPFFSNPDFLHSYKFRQRSHLYRSTSGQLSKRSDSHYDLGPNPVVIYWRVVYSPVFLLWWWTSLKISLLTSWNFSI